MSDSIKNYRRQILERVHPHAKAEDMLATQSPQIGDFTLNTHVVPESLSESLPEFGAKPKLAAVLVPVIEYETAPHILLTRRASHLASHSGQVAFPGGKLEPQDATPIDAALREAHEEVGLASKHVEIAGCLDVYATGSGFHILPVVGFVSRDFALRIDKSEVAEAFEVPLGFLMDERNHQKREGTWRGQKRYFYAMPYKQHYIWGATAGMLRNLHMRAFASYRSDASESDEVQA